MSLIKTFIWFIYFFGYMILHLPDLHKGERALTAGDKKTVRALTQTHVPHWCSSLMKLAGVKVTVEGKENLPDGPCIFAANHRSYYDIPVVLTSLGSFGLVSKQEVEKIPLVNRWMKLLGCVFVQRDDMKAGVRALNTAISNIKEGNSMIIFPEGTRYKGEEGGIGEFKGGVFRIALKTGVPIVPVAISHTRDAFENNHYLMHRADVTVRILPPVDTSALSREEQKLLPARMQELVQQNIKV